MTGRDAGWLRRLPVAHRGLHGRGGPAENSIEAVLAAARAGYAAEVDVRLLADGALAIFHDDTLARMCGRPGEIDRLTAGEVAALRLPGGERVPLLGELLDAVAGRAPLLVELKAAGRPRAIGMAAAAALAGYGGPLAVQCFDPRALWWLGRRAGHIPRGQLAGSLRDEDLPRLQKAALRRMLLNPVTRPRFIAYELAALPCWPASLWRRAGLPLLAWTVRDAAGLARARALADNVIFERVRP